MDNRKALRQEVRERRNALSEVEQHNFANSLVDIAANIERLQSAKRIAIYLTNDGELETKSLIQWCWKNNIKTALPIIHPFSKGHLLFVDYHENTTLLNNKYGIPEPQLRKEDIILLSEIDIVFTPLVAFDLNGSRLGMGGGYYDRTLASWFAARKAGNTLSFAYPIGIAHDCQRVEHIDNQAWDVPLPEIITPTQHHFFNLC